MDKIERWKAFKMNTAEAVRLDIAELVRYREALERIAAGVSADPKLIALKALGRA